MTRKLTLFGALVVLVGLAEMATAQELVRTYAWPQSYAYVGTATNYGYGVTPTYTTNYAPVGTTTYYSPTEVVTPTTAYYAPQAAVPSTAYYAPSVGYTTYYAPSVVAPYTTYYAPATAYTSYYSPYYYGRAYYYAPAPLVPGQPVRNAFRAMTW